VTDWDDDELPSRARRSPLLAVLAAVLAFALIAGLIDVVVRRPATKTNVESAPTTSVTVPPTTGSTRPASKSELEQTVAEISAFVAAQRKLAFQRPVPVKLLDDAAFSKRVADDAVDDEKELEKIQGVLHALGLLPDGTNLRDELKSFLSAGVVGFYDPKTDELVVRGEAITPYVRTTLAHELTHALDDQHYELDRPALDKADDETGLAFSALVEGNAVRVEERYKATLSKADRDAADAEEAHIGEGLDVSSMPRVIPELIGFPYIFGPTMVEALLDSGGERAVDDAFGKPPTTSELVIDPKGWLAGKDEPVHVAPPKADGAVVDQGSFGFWGFYMLLEDALGPTAARDAAAGWGGDWYVAWKRGNETCVRADAVMDTADDERQLSTALGRWADKQRDALVTRTSDGVELTVCR
jgi:hypothetical protein